MEPFIERMIKEKDELNERMTKLNSFISENPIFQTLPKEEQYDMHLQLQAMSMYYAVLVNRVQRAISK